MARCTPLNSESLRNILCNSSH